MSNKLTNEEFQKRILEKNPNVQFLTNYIVGNVSVKLRCTSCGNEWEIIPNHLLGKPTCKCPKCKNRVFDSKNDKYIGKRYGMLTVIKLDHVEQKYNKKGIKEGLLYFYLCKCDCGNYVVVRLHNLLSGNTKVS